MSTTTGLETLKINYLTQAQYNTASQNGEINENELYMTPDNGIVVSAEDASSPENYQENSVWLKYGSASGGQADWIVEQGTSGVWFYRKWNSGNVELWGEWTETKAHYSTVASALYGYTSQQELPFSVYTPRAVYSARVGSGFALAGTANQFCNEDVITHITVYCLATGSGSQPTTWQVYLKGTWK